MLLHLVEGPRLGDPEVLIAKKNACAGALDGDKARMFAIIVVSGTFSRECGVF